MSTFVSLRSLVMWKNVGVAKPKISCGLNLVFPKKKAHWTKL